MFHLHDHRSWVRRSRERFWLWGLLLGMLVSPVQAHKIQVDQGVGAMMHIEPKDQPRAGQPSLVWFALTRPGGTLIPLDSCDCQLRVYPQPSQEGDRPLDRPELQPIAAEIYTNIPSATITFPQVGAYTLVLTGEPLTPGNFQPFTLSFDVTVAR